MTKTKHCKGNRCYILNLGAISHQPPNGIVFNKKNHAIRKGIRCTSVNVGVVENYLAKDVVQLDPSLI